MKIEKKSMENSKKNFMLILKCEWLIKDASMWRTFNVVAGFLFETKLNGTHSQNKITGRIF